MTIASVGIQHTPRARKASPHKESQMLQESESVSIETITPAIATEYLKLNTRNRPMTPRRVKPLTEDMAAGRWRLGTDAIGFDRGNVLVNGQKRLAAVIASGTTQRFIVIRGLESDTFEDLDRNDPRRLPDDAHMMGLPHRNVVAAVSLKLAGWVKAGELTSYVVKGIGPTAGNRGATTRRERQAVQKTLGAEIVAAIRQTDRYAKEGLLPGSFVAFLAMVYGPEWPQIDAFLSRALTGVGIGSATDPAHALRTILIASAAKPAGQGRFDSATLTGFAILAANADKAGLRRKTLRWQADTGRDFPQPDVGTLVVYAAHFDWAAE